MTDFLDRMALESRERLARLSTASSRSAMESRLIDVSPPAPLSLNGAGFDVIAETKLASPSSGRLIETDGEAAVERLAVAYERAGACAISVLTTREGFSGANSHLERAAGVAAVPVMRKDFLVDPLQVTEARALGASGVLLIARIVDTAILRSMAETAIDLGMFALIELFDHSDIDRVESVLDLDVLIGVNSRDLTSLGIDLDRFARFRDDLPSDIPLVAESGIQGSDDVVAVASMGYRAALIGSHLSLSADPGAELARLLAAGRSAVEAAR